MHRSLGHQHGADPPGYSYAGVLHHAALGVALLRLAGLLALFDLGDHALERLGDVLVEARAGLDEAAAQLVGEFLAVGGRHLARFGAQVGFVADHHDGNGVAALIDGSVLH